MAILIISAAAGDATSGSERKKTLAPTSKAIKLSSFRFTGESALHHSSYGLATVTLKTVDAVATLVDKDGKPFKGDVEVLVSGGYFPGLTTNSRVITVKNGELFLHFKPMKHIPVLLLDFYVKSQHKIIENVASLKIPIVQPTGVTTEFITGHI